MKKRIIYGVELFQDDDGKWRDITGNVYAFPDDSASKDKTVRLGVGFFSLPVTHPLTQAATFHDAAYSNLEYQKTHTRSEVDREFLRQSLMLAGDSMKLRAEAYAMYATVRAVGGWWWECKETRRK